MGLRKLGVCRGLEPGVFGEENGGHIGAEIVVVFPHTYGWYGDGNFPWILDRLLSFFQETSCLKFMSQKDRNLPVVKTLMQT